MPKSDARSARRNCWRRSRWARPSNIACEAAGIVKDTYYRWRRGGKALHLGEDSPDIPYFAPRQPDETDDAWFERKYLWDWDFAQLEDLFLTGTRTIARKRVA